MLPRLPQVVQENAALRAQLAAQHAELAQLRERARHEAAAEELAASFGAQAAQVATVIGRTLVPTQHLLIVDRGRRDGLIQHSIVVDAAGLIGRVTEVRPTTSSVLLITDPDSRIACLIARSRESGLLIGTGESLCQLVYLDLDADIVVNDEVMTAGVGGPFPKGLLVGRVVRIDQDARNAQTVAWVRPAAKLHRVEEVLCLAPSSFSSP